VSRRTQFGGGIEREMTAGRAPRVLIVSYWFAPFTAVASRRMGTLAKHLLDRGWDVRALAADRTNPATMPLEIPADRIVYTPWSDVDRGLSNALARLRGTKQKHRADKYGVNAPDEPRPAAPARFAFLRRVYRRIYQEIVRWPDNRAGWLSPACDAGDKLIATWRPDVIYCTAPPVTSLIVADRLARKHGVPWVAEFRDLWCDNPYYEFSAFRRFFERRWERRVLARASAIVSVSPVWLHPILDRFGPPVIAAMNGFVASEYPEPPPVPPETSGPLRILYTGHIYAGRRDPGPLFTALRDLGARAEDVVVEFVGTEIGAAASVADRYGVAHLVRAFPPVPYRQSLGLQLRADVLLHMQWCDPKEAGTIAGKIFDYLGARRPILGIALEDSMVAKMVHERGAGLVTNSPVKIAAQIDTWIAQKRAGGVAPLPPSAAEGLERTLQFDKIQALLADIAAGRRKSG
jgi:glycosyltransferase involved in cell wall biosynthesis